MENLGLLVFWNDIIFLKINWKKISFPKIYREKKTQEKKKFFFYKSFTEIGPQINFFLKNEVDHLNNYNIKMVVENDERLRIN